MFRTWVPISSVHESLKTTLKSLPYQHDIFLSGVNHTLRDTWGNRSPPISDYPRLSTRHSFSASAFTSSSNPYSTSQSAPARDHPSNSDERSMDWGSCLYPPYPSVPQQKSAVHLCSHASSLTRPQDAPVAGGLSRRFLFWWWLWPKVKKRSEREGDKSKEDAASNK